MRSNVVKKDRFDQAEMGTFASILGTSVSVDVGLSAFMNVALALLASACWHYRRSRGLEYSSPASGPMQRPLRSLAFELLLVLGPLAMLFALGPFSHGPRAGAFSHAPRAGAF